MGRDPQRADSLVRLHHPREADLREAVLPEAGPGHQLSPAWAKSLWLHCPGSVSQGKFPGTLILEG